MIRKRQSRRITFASLINSTCYGYSYGIGSRQAFLFFAVRLVLQQVMSPGSRIFGLIDRLFFLHNLSLHLDCMFSKTVVWILHRIILLILLLLIILRLLRPLVQLDFLRLVAQLLRVLACLTLIVWIFVLDVEKP